MAGEKTKKTQKKWEKYKIDGNTLKRTNRTCPKCGHGVFLAEHKNRWSCGSCGYMERKPQGTPQEESGGALPQEQGAEPK